MINPEISLFDIVLNINGKSIISKDVLNYLNLKPHATLSNVYQLKIKYKNNIITLDVIVKNNLYYNTNGIQLTTDSINAINFY